MEFDTESVKSMCNICGQEYHVEIRTEASCRDEFGRLLRSMQQTIATRSRLLRLEFLAWDMQTTNPGGKMS